MAESEDYKGLRSPFASTSPTNAAAYQIKQELRQVHTNFLAIVQDCASSEEGDGAKTVTALPAVMQIDGENNSLQMAKIPKCPHYRVQQGICALIIDPVPGDIGVFNALKADSTNVQQGTTEPQRPGSLSEFSQSNAVMVGSVHTKKPENWITLRQDKTRESYAPEGVLNRTDKTIREEMGENHEWEVAQNGTHHYGQNLTTNIDQNESRTIGQNIEINIGNNCTIVIGADKNITISGNFTGTISGNANLSVQGNCTLSVTGNATITAPQVTIDSPMTNVTGNMTIAGTLSQGVGGGGTATFGGTVNARGTVHSDADVTAGGISLNSHTHSGVEPGPGSTGGPQ